MNLMGLDIQLLGHSSVRISDKRIIYIDPFEISEGTHVPKADIILITHAHYDHCSIKDIEKIKKQDSIAVTVADCQSKLANLGFKDVRLVEPGSKLEVNGIKIEAVPAYNTNKQFHPKENQWVGFIIEVDGVKIYHAGDTDLIPEMKTIDVDIAFLPVSGTYVMNAAEAAQATRTFSRCKVAIPMHYGSIVGNGSDAENFKNSAGCEVRILL